MFLLSNKLIILFLTATIFFGCKQTTEENYQLYKHMSERVAGKKLYTRSATAIHDSTVVWGKYNIYIGGNFSRNNWRIDSLICFNSRVDKLITCINFSQTIKRNSGNYSLWIYGVKIKEKWYFFTGPGIHYFSENYDKKKDQPLSFQKLHEIAMQEVFRGYLKKKKVGFWKGLFNKPEYEINDRFFNQLDYSKWGFFDKDGTSVDNSKLTQDQLDSCLLRKAVFEKWKAKDTTNYSLQ